ncbi:MAG: hypothetical protein DRQ88_08950 [Epsilonproteobacteria bacterium]|nr:MAG: hypothetical protein DRQ89_06535 [Campylobacterota bacterium]RLA65660.1 MAG: hypothetical protein DRQ88_08950 [Campylobacterota bacterium]
MNNHQTFKNVIIVFFGLLPLFCPISSGIIKSSPEALKSSAGIPLIILIFFLGYFFKGSYGTFLKRNSIKFFLLFLGWCLLSLSWAINPYDGLVMVMPWIGAAFAFFVIAKNFNSPEDIKLFLKVMALSGIVAGGIGVLQSIANFSFFNQAAWPGSTFGNKNMAAQYMVMTLPLVFAQFFAGKNWRKEVPWLFGASIMIIYVLFIQSRSSFLSITFQLMLLGGYSFWQFRKKGTVPFFTKRKLKFLTGALVFILISINLSSKGINSLTNRVGSITNQATTDFKSANPRISYYANSLYMLKDHPLGGIGIGNWYATYPLYHDKVLKDKLFNDKVKVSRLHNDFLEILVTTGLVGGALFLTFLFFTFKDALVLLKKPEVENKNLLIFMTLGMAGFLVFGNFSFPMQVFVPMIVLLTYSGVISSTWAREQNVERENYLLPKKILSFSVFVLVMVMGYRFLYSTHNYFNGKAFDGKIKRGKKARYGRKLIKYGEISTQLNPYNWRGALLLSKGYHYLNNDQKAHETLKNALKYNPYNNTILNNVGIYSLKAGKLEETIEYWERAQLNHSDPNYVQKMRNNIKALKRALQKKNMAGK